MYLGLHKSVSTTRGNYTGLGKPGQLSQVKGIQPKTKYTCKESPKFIPRQQSFYTIVYSAPFFCLTYAKARLLSKFDLTDFLSREFIWCMSMYDKMFYHPSRKQNGEIAMNSKVFDILNLTSTVSNTPTKTTPCARVVF